MLIGSMCEQRPRFAENMLRKAGVPEDGRLAAAFSRMRREDFVGPPWLIREPRGYREALSDDVSPLGPSRWCRRLRSEPHSAAILPASSRFFISL